MNTGNFPNSINELLFISDTDSILCEAQTEILCSQRFKEDQSVTRYVP